MPTFRPPTAAVIRPNVPALSAVAKWQPNATSSTARSADCAHLKDMKIRKLQQGAVKEGFKSHTDRYDESEAYRANCLQHTPHPTLRLLQHSTLEWASVEGPDHEKGFERHAKDA